MYLAIMAKAFIHRDGYGHGLVDGRLLVLTSHDGVNDPIPHLAY
jgi:hypothetical protein